MSKDIFDERAEELLPCSTLPGCTFVETDEHHPNCAVWHRRAVAAALREQAEETARLKQLFDYWQGKSEKWSDEIDKANTLINQQAERIKALEEGLKPIASWNLKSEMSGIGVDHTEKDKLLDTAIKLARAALEGK